MKDTHEQLSVLIKDMVAEGTKSCGLNFTTAIRNLTEAREILGREVVLATAREKVLATGWNQAAAELLMDIVKERGAGAHVLKSPPDAEEVARIASKWVEFDIRVDGVRGDYTAFEAISSSPPSD